MIDRKIFNTENSVLSQKKMLEIWWKTEIYAASDDYVHNVVFPAKWTENPCSSNWEKKFNVFDAGNN